MPEASDLESGRLSWLFFGCFFLEKRNTLKLKDRLFWICLFVLGKSGEEQWKKLCFLLPIR